MSVDPGVNIDLLAEWVGLVAESQGMVACDVPPRLVSTWSSRTATLHRFTLGAPSHRDVVVKVHTKPEHAYAQFHGMCDTSRALEALPSSDGALSAPLAVSEALRAVLMPYVSGTRLSDLLERNLRGSGDTRHEVFSLVRSCGALLARYHNKLTETSPPARQLAWEDLSFRMTNVLGPRPSIRQLAENGLVAQSYGDFHPGHVIVTEGKKLVLLDPPIEVKYRYVYRDLALYIYYLYMPLIQPRVMLWSLFRQRYYESLVKGFLDGYASEMGRCFTEDDHFFINGSLAFLFKRRLRTFWRRRSHALLSYHLIPLKFRILGLKQAMHQHLRRQFAVGQQHEEPPG